MFQTSNIVCRSVSLTDELKIGLEYDSHRGLLNIFVKNTESNIDFPSQINILSNQYKNDDYHYCSSEIKQGLIFDYYLLIWFDLILILILDLQDEITDVSYREEDEPKICIELSNIYVYDLYDENENDLCQTMITSPSSLLLFSSSLSSSSSSCSDEQTIDNDDGYSTHSLDDIDQHHPHQSISIPSSKFIIPFVPYQPHHFNYSSEEYISSIHRLIGQVMWLSPFKKTVKQMMFSWLFLSGFH